MISANGGLPAHRYTPQVTPRWPRGSELASTAGSAKGGGGWGSGREHVRQVRNGCGVPQVHVDPRKGSSRRARAFV